MPTSVMKFLTVKAPATVYRLMCFRFGGDEEFFDRSGYGTFNYIAAIKLGPNPALLVDRVDGTGIYAVERAGYVSDFDLVAAWQWVLRHFDKLPENGVMTLEQNADLDWEVKSVESV